MERVIGWLLLRLPPRVLAALSGGAPLVIDGGQLDPGVNLLRAARARKARYGLIEPTVAVGRARYRRDARAFVGPRTPVGSVRDLAVAGAAGPLGARLYLPPGNVGNGAPLLVYLHGGGFVIGDLDTHDEPCRVLCRHGRTAVLSVAYRLAPEHPFPAAVDDALAAWRWARTNAGALGIDWSRISIGGDSAGGNLAAVVSLLTARTDDAPEAQLLIYPAIDPVTARTSRELFADGLFLTMRDVAAFEREYRGGRTGDARDPRAAPIFADDLSSLPPALVITAGFDVLRDEGEAYGAALATAGNRVRQHRFPSLVHGFIHMTDISPTARRAMRTVAVEFRSLRDSSTRSAGKRPAVNA